MSLLFNTLSKCQSIVNYFPSKEQRLLILWLQWQFTVILETKKRKSVNISTFSPSICHEVKGPDAMILVFWMLSFKPAFSLSSFTFTKSFFSSSSFSATRVVPSVSEFGDSPPSNLDSSFHSSSLAFHMKYHTIALISHASKVMLKILKPGFSNTWTLNFQMFKLVLEKAEEPEIKLPSSTGSSKKQGSSRETSTSALLTTPSHWLYESQQIVENSSRDENTRPLSEAPEKSVCRSRSNI